MRNEEVQQVYEIARKVVREQASLTIPAKVPVFNDSALKGEIAKLKSEVTSLRDEIKAFKEKPVNKKK